MAKSGLKARLFLSFIVLLSVAMLLQSSAVFLLGLHNSVKRELEFTINYLGIINKNVSVLTADSRQLSTSLSFSHVAADGAFSCSYAKIEDQIPSKESRCKYKEAISKISKQAIADRSVTVDFAGITWSLLFFRDEVVIGSTPLITSDGHVLGTLSVERSLLPVYESYKAEAKIALVYLLINALVFSSIAFFRMVRMTLRPIDRLVQLAEKYRPDGDVSFSFEQEGGEFRKLTSGLKGMFDRIEQDNDKLRHSVDELKKVNRELQENKKLIVRSEKLASVGRLSAGLAHEIGNPLSIIQGYIELLGRKDLTEEDKTVFSEKASVELDRINKLIRQLLNFAKPAGSSMEKISINKLVEEIVEFISIEKSFKNGLLNLQLNAQPDEVWTEKESLRQVILNCLLNAADSMGDDFSGSKSLLVSTKSFKTEDEGAALYISISDEGCGIPEEQLDNVFDPFFTTKETGKGTGLGLFVSHAIMDRLSGSISIRNRSEGGVEVVLMLPAHNEV